MSIIKNKQTNKTWATCSIKVFLRKVSTTQDGEDNEYNSAQREGAVSLKDRKDRWNGTTFPPPDQNESVILKGVRC